MKFPTIRQVFDKYRIFTLQEAGKLLGLDAEGVEWRIKYGKNFNYDSMKVGNSSKAIWLVQIKEQDVQDEIERKKIKEEKRKLKIQ